MRSFKLSLALIAAGALAACTELTTLEQQNPGQLDASGIYEPRNAQLLANGVIADFECAFSRYAFGSALFTDELTNAFAGSSNFDYDRRTLPTNAPYGTGGCNTAQTASIYTPLSIARAAGDTVASKLEGWSDTDVPNRQKLLAQSYAYAGYSLTLLGESMCGAAINVGPLLTPAQLFAEARTRFDKAVAAATAANDAPTLNLSLLGRARTLLNLGEKAAAGVDAAKIPAGFTANLSTDAGSPRRQNYVFLGVNQSSWGSVDPSFRGLTVNGAPDPRVAVTNANRNGTVTSVQIWTADKYTSLASTIPVARYAEAQLIVAEAKLAANDIPGAVAAINIVRAARSIPAYDATGRTSAEVLSQIIEERRRELFLEGHRLGDLRRYNQTFLPAAGTPFVSGGQYGTQTCFPLPDVERINNPNIGAGS
jgi:starch-binding outer membrane protein, SusD/RagB family